MAEAAPAAEGGPGEAAAKPQAAGGLTPLMLERSVKQIEFYFSDSNLPRDKFLLDKVHASPAGWVDLGLVATFERMRELLKARDGGRRTHTCHTAALPAA
jgi:La domain